MVRAFLGVGSNLGGREKNLSRAKILLEKRKGVKVAKVSPVYETEPVGGPPQGKYLNAVWEIETDLGAEELLKVLLQIESELGRKRRLRNEPRPIDLDILFYGSEVIRRPGLVIPHPRLHEREFVLRPLADLAPAFVHPELRKTVRRLLEECP